jgi:hypothetical protein
VLKICLLLQSLIRYLTGNKNMGLLRYSRKKSRAALNRRTAEEKELPYYDLYDYYQKKFVGLPELGKCNKELHHLAENITLLKFIMV